MASKGHWKFNLWLFFVLALLALYSFMLDHYNVQRVDRPLDVSTDHGNTP